MTTDAVANLFADPGSNTILRRFAQEIRSLPGDPIQPAGLIQNLRYIIELMISQPEIFDEYAASNVEWIGRSFISELTNFFGSSESDKRSAIISIFTSTYRFLCEIYFTRPGESAFEVHRVLNFVHQNIDEFSGNDRQQLIYASYLMPANVAKRLIGHPSIVEFKNFSETIEQSRKLKEEWDEKLESRINLLKGLDANIGKLTSSYNFVGLVHGFQELRRTKEGERKFSYWSLIVLAIAMLLPPTLQLTFVASHIDVVDTHRKTLVYTLPTIIALEVGLIYFFRVVLGQFRSVKAQLLQIDLRISLCQFIESFSDYASKVRKQDATALAKFEALIFSGLVTDEGGIPSTFDGAEQIANLIRSLRGGKD